MIYGGWGRVGMILVGGLTEDGFRRSGYLSSMGMMTGLVAGGKRRMANNFLYHAPNGSSVVETEV